MNITCPKNPDHKRFSSTAHEVHDWEVDENGDFVKDMGCTETTHFPNSSDRFVCLDCFAEAKVEI